MTLARLLVAKPRRSIFMLLLILLGYPAKAEDYSFVTLRLPHGVTIDAPRTWKALNEEQNNLIALARDAALDLSGLGIRYTGNVLFAANSTPQTTYASMRVTIDPDMAASPADLAEIENTSESDLKAIEPAYEAMLQQSLAPHGIQVLATLALVKEKYAQYPALSYRYRRTGPGGPVIVDLIQVFRSDAAIRINLAYRESEQLIWKVVIARIKQSIAIE